MPQLDFLTFKIQISFIFLYILSLLVLNIFIVLPRILSSLKSRELLKK